MKVNSINLYNIYKTSFQKPSKVKTSEATSVPLISDTINISDEAKKMYDFISQVELAAKIIEKVPDIRHDKVAEVQQKIKQNFYNNPKIYKEVAKKILF